MIIGGGYSGLAQVATSGPSGYALTNSTGRIVWWTAPNDGNLHTVVIAAFLNITATLTGGHVGFSATTGGVAYTGTLTSASSVGHYPIDGYLTFTIDPGSTIAVTQLTAVTAGTADLYYELWAQ